MKGMPVLLSHCCHYPHVLCDRCPLFPVSSFGPLKVGPFILGVQVKSDEAGFYSACFIFYCHVGLSIVASEIHLA